jgi:Chemotaxis protein histidine kinase and related kinases
MESKGIGRKRRNLFINIITSGTYFDRPIEERVKIIFTNSVIILGLLILGAFTYLNYQRGQVGGAIAVGAVLVLSTLMLIYLRVTKKTWLPSVVCTTELALLFLYMAYTGGDSMSGILWVFSLPLVAVFMNGFVAGLAYSGLLMLGFCAILFVPALNVASYAPAFSARVAGVYLLVSIFTLVYEYTKNLKDRQIAAKQRTIEEKSAEIELMKDNLDDGILLVDESLVIQGEYSKSLETIFCGQVLAGLDFAELLGRYLSPEKTQELREHMPLVFARGNDDIVKSLNPLESERFDFDVGGRVERKYLCFKFSKVVRGDEEYVLVTIGDVTERVELEERIRREEAERASEIEQLLSIIKIGAPSMVLDFVSDAEESIAVINRFLKSNDSPRETLNRMSGLIHAVKGDAAQLGMTNLAGRFHAIEDKLAVLRRFETLKKEDFIAIVVDINNALDEIEKLKEMLERIRAMQEVENELNPKTILVEALLRVIKNASASRGSDVVLRINKESMEDELVGGRYRKLIKDVLIQLVRNSMSHGIESADERLGQGKDAKGAISVVVKREAASLVLLYKDDGRGIDVEAVKGKAIELGLKPEPELRGLSEREACELIFEPGLSTAKSVDELAGRGIGMDLIKSEITECGGSIDIISKRGQGCQFRVTLPLGAA